jgi:hypothetical protein
MLLAERMLREWTCPRHLYHGCAMVIAAKLIALLDRAATLG